MNKYLLNKQYLKEGSFYKNHVKNAVFELIPATKLLYPGPDKRNTSDLITLHEDQLSDADGCLFICQNQHVLDIYKATYCNQSAFKEDDESPKQSPATQRLNNTFVKKLTNDLFPKMRVENKVLDMVCGVALFCYIWFYVDIKTVSDALIRYTTIFATFLDDTISSLAQAPAGLKLNAQLGEFLGLFFRYHIHLFKGYLQMMSGYVPLILYSVSLTCIPGFSCFLSYTISFSVLLYIHVHCFASYASNLYSAQVKALMSLGRLLGGIKYNPLRRRVDSVKIHGDQLILGTLIFSTLLFLFPTTLIYYTVFTAVNFVLVLIQMSVVCLVSVIRTFPVRDVFNVLIKHHSAVVDITIEPRDTENLGNVFIVSDVFEKLGDCVGRTSLGNHKLSFKEIRKKLVSGDVIKISF